MAPVDDFLRNHVQGGLEPGESILGMGLLRHPTRFNAFGVPQNYDNYLGVATDRRLIVFETEIGGMMTPTARPVARNPAEWRYDELARVSTKGVEGAVVHSGGAGTVLHLQPHFGCGPLAAQQGRFDDVGANPAEGVGRRYDIYLQCDGLDSQAQLQRQFPGWLEQRVAAGAFPMAPDKRAMIEQRIAAKRAELAAAQADQLRRAAERDAKLKAGWQKLGPYVVPGVIALVGLGVAGWGAVELEAGLSWTADNEEAVAHYEPKVKMLESDLATWVRRPDLQPPPDCPDKSWPPGPYSRGRPEDTCHLCRPGPAYANSYGMRRAIVRDGAPWSCPSVGEYEHELAEAKRQLTLAEGSVERGQGKTILGIILVAAALLVTPIAVFLARRLMRPKGPAAGGPPPGAPAMGPAS